MTKNLLLVSALALSGLAFGQVGINNAAPNATLDVSAKTTNGTRPEGFIAPRLTGDQMAAGDAQYTNLQTGTLVYATAGVSGTPVGKTINVIAPGYYYYDGAASIPRWMRVANPSLATDTTDDAWINSGTSVILQNTDGIARPAGTEFVALSNGNVGIGTALPQRPLQVVGGAVIGNPTEYVPGSYNALQLNNDGGDPKNTFRIDPFANQFDIVAESQTGATVGASIALRTSAAGAADATVKLLVDPAGNVGIGTTTPTTKLQIVAPSPGTGFTLQDGSQGLGKVLASNTSGNAEWVNNVSTTPTVIGTNGTLPETPLTANSYLGRNITLPIGKWIITIGQLFSNLNQLAGYTTNVQGEGAWIRIGFGSSATDIALPPSVTYITQAANISVNASYTPGNYAFGQGSILVNVTAPTTLFLWTLNCDFSPQSSANSSKIKISFTASENFLYASPIN